MCSEGELRTPGGGGLQLPPLVELFWHPCGGWGHRTRVVDVSASFAEALVESGGLRVIGASRGANTQTSWWTLVVRESVQLKKESFQDMLSCGTPEAIGRYPQAQRQSSGYVRSSEKPWRRTINWLSGKPSCSLVG